MKYFFFGPPSRFRAGRRREAPPQIDTRFDGPEDLQVEFHGPFCADLLSSVTARAFALDRAFSVHAGEVRAEGGDERLTLRFTHPGGKPRLQKLDVDLRQLSKEIQFRATGFEFNSGSRFELLALVPNEPGVLARISELVDQAGFHIRTLDVPAETQRADHAKFFEKDFPDESDLFSMWFDLRFRGRAAAAPDLRAVLERADPRWIIRFFPRADFHLAPFPFARL